MLFLAPGCLQEDQQCLSSSPVKRAWPAVHEVETAWQGSEPCRHSAKYSSTPLPQLSMYCLGFILKAQLILPFYIEVGFQELVTTMGTVSGVDIRARLSQPTDRHGNATVK